MDVATAATESHDGGAVDDSGAATAGASGGASSEPVLHPPTVTVDSMPALDPSLYVPQDPAHRRDFAEGDDNINIIEEGEHVSAEDFGLSSTEISMSAPITMNVGMDMQHIDAFLARPSSAAHQPHSADTTPMPASVVSAETVTLVSERDEASAHPESGDRPPSAETQRSPAASTPETSTEAETPTEIRVANASSRTPAFSSRRDSKVVQLQTHPLVESLSPDGCKVRCKCGKTVRLNPPWYILKFEQHIVSRNCTFLRKKKTKQMIEFEEKLARMKAAKASGVDSVETATTRVAQSSATDDSQLESALKTSAVPTESATLTNTRDEAHHGGYKLHTADVLVSILNCESVPESTKPVQACEDRVLAIQVLDELKMHPQFSRITPDGRFVECKCSTLIILSAPWELKEFTKHTAMKCIPTTAPRRKSISGSGVSKKPRIGEGASYRMEQRMSTRETRWQPVSSVRELPCPGIRNERASAYISGTTKISGGGRSRRRIAEELFPHHFAPNPSNIKPPRPKLSADEKLLLHDAVESEAIWFIDRDANSIRSMDCRGSIAIHKGEDVCPNCTELLSSSSLRISLTVFPGQKRAPASSLTSKSDSNAPMTSGFKFSMLEQEFNMAEEYARLLRDLFRADVEERSPKNLWFDMAELGISELFTSHPAFLGVLESMMMLKEKERRGVGMQNMLYNEHLDAFMKSLSGVSPEACDFFQRHLGGRKQKSLLAKRRKTEENGGSQAHRFGGSTAAVFLERSAVASDTHGGNVSQSHSSGDGSQASLHVNNGVNVEDVSALSANPNVQNLSVADVHEVDLASFHSTRVVEHDSRSVKDTLNARTTHENDESDALLTDDNVDPSEATQPVENVPIQAPGFRPCRGIRDEKVRHYVVSAVQIIGGSRPKYVIAKELFPEIFGDSRQIKIREKLTEAQRLIVQDAIFSECLWRVDKVGNCVRSLRCFRRVDKKQSNGICRACMELKSVANFRSVLCRAKTPKKVENLKYVPSVYTESDPFLRKLSKNASLRALYQTVKRIVREDKKRVTFWLRLAKLGLFGHFRSHLVFEGLVASMVEIKDRERRGVGKQNMTYAKPLDDFMTELAAISQDAVELFSHHFCGRSMRSHKVKKRKNMTSMAQVYNQTFEEAMAANTIAMAAATASASASAMAMTVIASGVQCVEELGSQPQPTEASAMAHHHQLPSQPPASAMVPLSMPTTTTTTPTTSDSNATMMMSDDLLGTTRAITTAEMEESQRFMDRMLDEVRLSHDIHLHEDGKDTHEQDEQLDPQTYLDENGVLTTVL